MPDRQGITMWRRVDMTDRQGITSDREGITTDPRAVIYNRGAPRSIAARSSTALRRSLLMPRHQEVMPGRHDGFRLRPEQHGGEVNDGTLSGWKHRDRAWCPLVVNLGTTSVRVAVET
jgi:hypothetical protein